jgi:hypothetical protein
MPKKTPKRSNPGRRGLAVSLNGMTADQAVDTMFRKADAKLSRATVKKARR